MIFNTPESPKRIQPNQQDILSPSEFQHSEGAYVSPEISRKRIERLKTIITTDRKPYHLLNTSDFSPDPTGSKSLAQIILESEANKISTNRASNLDSVSYTCATFPERIVRIREKDIEGAPVRGNSAHGVLFLKLGTQRGKLMDVAVKTFSTPSRALMEYVNTLIIQERGIETINPIAVIIDKEIDSEKKERRNLLNATDEPIGFYISAMESIRSIDRLRIIRNGYANILSIDNQKFYLNYLYQIGKILADMHLKGIFPGDSQIKNFTIREDGSVIPIDFENTDIFNTDFFLSNPEKFEELSFKSLSVLFASLSGQTIPQIDFYKGFLGDNLWDAFKITIFNAYSKRFEDTILAQTDANKLDVAQFTQALDSLGEIENKIKDRILIFTNSAKKH
jgi:hypothetical protein